MDSSIGCANEENKMYIHPSKRLQAPDNESVRSQRYRTGSGKKIVNRALSSSWKEPSRLKSSGTYKPSLFEAHADCLVVSFGTYSPRLTILWCPNKPNNKSIAAYFNFCSQTTCLCFGRDPCFRQNTVSFTGGSFVTKNTKVT